MDELDDMDEIDLLDKRVSMEAIGHDGKGSERP
jgi:hypothetical protein